MNNTGNGSAKWALGFQQRLFKTFGGEHTSLVNRTQTKNQLILPRMQIGKRKDAENSEGKRNNPSLQNALVGVESWQKVVESRSHVVRITLRNALIALHRRDHDHTVVHRVQSVSKENVSIREDTAQHPRHLLPGEDGVVFHPTVFVDIRLGIDQLRTGVG